MRIWAVIPAAGIGLRYRSTIPKQYLPLCGKPVVRHSIDRLIEIEEIKELFLTCQLIRNMYAAKLRELKDNFTLSAKP